MKLGRNDLCWCARGLKYKFCHLVSDRERLVEINPELHPAGTPSTLDYRDDISNVMSRLQGPLAAVCKDAGSYFFSSCFTVGHMEEALKRLECGQLHHAYFIDTYKECSNREIVEAWIRDACENYDSFRGRDPVLLDAIDAHFSGKYTLSIPTLFAQLEGVLREIGGLRDSATIRPTIPRGIWSNRLLFSLGDSVDEFNSFVSRLFEGQKTGFNRNPILHGINSSYASEENSLTLILCLLEIRVFLWFERNTRAYV